MIAAARLQSMIESREGSVHIAEIVVKMNRVIEAVGSVVPSSMWPEISRKLDGDDEAAEPLDEDEAGIFDPADDPFGANELDEPGD
jgi:hypothetical protein